MTVEGKREGGRERQKTSLPTSLNTWGGGKGGAWDVRKEEKIQTREHHIKLSRNKKGGEAASHHPHRYLPSLFSSSHFPSVLPLCFLPFILPGVEAYRRCSSQILGINSSATPHLTPNKYPVVAEQRPPPKFPSLPSPSLWVFPSASCRPAHRASCSRVYIGTCYMIWISFVIRFIYSLLFVFSFFPLSL